MKVARKAIIAVRCWSCGVSRQASSSTAASTTQDLTSSQKELQEHAREFTRCHVTPTAHRYDASGEFPWDVHKAAHAARLTADSVASLSDQCIVGEEIAAGCSAIFSTMAATATAMYPVYSFGSAEMKKRYIPLMTHQSLAAASASMPHHVTANKQPASVQLKSSPSFVANAGNASVYVVIARTSSDTQCAPADAYTGFLVDKHWLGVNVGQKFQSNGHRCADIRALSFENTLVPEENIIGKLGGGLRISQGLLARSSLMDAVCNIGIARRALQLIVLERPDSGLLLPMSARVEATRLLIKKAAGQLDKGHTEAGGTTAELAKWCSGDAAVSNTMQAQEVIGEENESVNKLMRDANFLNRPQTS